MRSLLLSVIVLVMSMPLVWGAAPSRTHTYVTGQTIDASEVTTNEDNIFSYLQAGVDTYVVGSVDAAALADNSVATGEIVDDTITATDLNATLTMTDGDLLDFSASNASTTTDGMILPQNTDCSSATAEGQVCWDSDSDTLNIGDASASVTVGVSVSNLIAFTRTTGQSTGATSYTGMGFQPTALFILCNANATDDTASIGMCDDEPDEMDLTSNTTGDWTDNAAEVIDITDATNEWVAVCTTMDSDGFTLTWTKGVSGLNLDCVSMGIR